MKYLMHRYNSIHKFVDEAARKAEKSGASHGNGGWAGTATFDQAVSFAKFGGWEPASAPEFRRIFDELVPKLRKFTDLNLERFSDVVGDEVNVAAYLNGEPDHMFDWVPQETETTKRALCLIVGHSISAGCTAEELFVRGQALIGLVRALSLLGYELEIWSEESVNPNGGGRGQEMWSALIRLHAAGEIMDESAIEFAIGNPAWLRRLLFGLQEGEPQDVRRRYGFTSGGGYGSVAEIQHAGLVNADIQLNLGRTWFGERGYGSGGERTARDGVDWIVAQLKELGALPEDAEIDWEEG